MQALITQKTTWKIYNENNGMSWEDYINETGENVKKITPTYRNQGAYTPVSRIIEIAKEHTPDTFLHEVSHNFFMNYFDAIDRIADKNSKYVKEGNVFVYPSCRIIYIMSTNYIKYKENKALQKDDYNNFTLNLSKIEILPTKKTL